MFSFPGEEYKQAVTDVMVEKLKDMSVIWVRQGTLILNINN